MSNRQTCRSNIITLDCNLWSWPRNDQTAFSLCFIMNRRSRRDPVIFVASCPRCQALQRGRVCKYVPQKRVPRCRPFLRPWRLSLLPSREKEGWAVTAAAFTSALNSKHNRLHRPEAVAAAAAIISIRAGVFASLCRRDQVGQLLVRERESHEQQKHSKTADPGMPYSSPFRSPFSTSKQKRPGVRCRAAFVWAMADAR